MIQRKYYNITIHTTIKTVYKMLSHAFYYSEELQNKYREIMYDKRYVYYFPSSYRNLRLETPDNEWAQEQYVSVGEQNKLLGYFDADIDRETDSVSNLSVCSFCVDSPKDTETFVNDLRKFVRSLLGRYRKISFYVLVGNPAEKHYDKITELIGGRVVGVHKQHRYNADKQLCDVKMYEIFGKTSTANTQNHF